MSRVLQTHPQVYLDIASVGDRDNDVGTGWVTGWFGRNLRIFVNLVRLLKDEAPERVLVIYGSGPIPLLQQMARDSGLFHVESPVPYLLSTP